MVVRTIQQSYCDFCGIIIEGNAVIKPPNMKATLVYSAEYLGENAGFTNKYVDLCFNCNKVVNQKMKELRKELNGKVGNT